MFQFFDAFRYKSAMLPLNNMKENADPVFTLFCHLHRDMEQTQLHELVDDCKNESVESLANLLIVWWHIRAVRGIGKGERKLFYDMIPLLIQVMGVEPIIATIHLIPKFGYFKDYCNILKMNINNQLNEKILDLFVSQLQLDEKKMHARQSISLAAKFAPSEKSQFHEIARGLAEKMYTGEDDCYKKYRLLKSELNKYMKTTERLASSQQDINLNFEYVSSLCLKQFIHKKNSKLLECETLKGKELFPNEIVKELLYNTIDEVKKHAYNLQWKSMVQCIRSSCPMPLKVLAIPNISVTGDAMEIAIGLSILMSDLYANKIMLFGKNPQYLVFEDDDDINTKINKIVCNEFSDDLNLGKVYEQILTSDFIPDKLIILSTQTYSLDRKEEERLKNEFKIKSLGFPELVHWNTHVSTNSICGKSPTFLQHIHKGGMQEIYQSILDDENFSIVKKTLTDLEGPFTTYSNDFVFV